MTGWSVRSDVLVAGAHEVEAVADAILGLARLLGAVLARTGPTVAAVGDVDALVLWARGEAVGALSLGPAGALREVVALRSLAEGLRGAARLYAEVDDGVSAVLRGVADGADLASRVGWLADGHGPPVVRPVPASAAPERLRSARDVIELGARLDGARVRVVEVSRGELGSAWVVAIPGTQVWDPRAGPNPFDLTTDVRALTGDPTVAAAGVVAALDLARARAGHTTGSDPVLLVGHSQGGILAAALAGDPSVAARHAVTHVVTTGAPIGVLPVPEHVQVLSVEHARDPVPALDLTPNPVRPSWCTLRTSGSGLPLDTSAHDLDRYVATVAAAEGAHAGPGAGIEGVASWRVSAGAFLGGRVRSVSEFEIERGWQNPRS